MRKLTAAFMSAHADALEGLDVRPGRSSCSACYSAAVGGRLRQRWEEHAAAHTQRTHSPHVAAHHAVAVAAAAAVPLAAPLPIQTQQQPQPPQPSLPPLLTLPSQTPPPPTVSESVSAGAPVPDPSEALSAAAAAMPAASSSSAGAIGAPPAAPVVPTEVQQCFSAICHAAKATVEPLTTVLEQQLAQRLISERFSFDSPDQYVQAITDALARNDLLLLRDHPNFPRNLGSLPPLSPDTPPWAHSVDVATGNCHYMTRLDLTSKQLDHCTNTSFHARYNQLCRLSATHQLAGYPLYFVQTLNSGAPFHIDFAGTESSQLSGAKIWLTVAIAEAVAEGIGVVDMRWREDQHTLAQLLRCQSFRWFVKRAGDTLIMPADRLHATHTVGNEVARSMGHYVATTESWPWIQASWKCAPKWALPAQYRPAVKKIFETKKINAGRKSSST